MKPYITTLVSVLFVLSNAVYASTNTTQHSVSISSEALIPLLIELEGRTEISTEKLEQIRNTEILIPVFADELVSEPDKNLMVTMNSEGEVRLIALSQAGIGIQPVFSSWAELDSFFDSPSSAYVTTMKQAAEFFLRGKAHYMLVDGYTTSLHLNVSTLRKIADIRTSPLNSEQSKKKCTCS
ncbi:SseB family protein [Vibrio europaeus]|uniref:SseB protein N-terminal domain-containing protein n=1 Tax=Vibrio europaeus TaxID=300876 RepID=A0AAE7DZR7_9VIBR|nr:SseB family protein [Vibrio europaeus]MDC5804929.1 SseB family protein [Vibrio europaeus]MDC5811766.1 SseB family protein [Vibrio europaeus]MDC5826996.1 SseB family protein [Vibrio europaeus]MDC5832362.1 SseB family protein [Vibrio europaeus]MDC5835317.1 SseB family protein [Vibrio europaeus]